MVMAVRCPAATCQKFMLVEAEQRGTIIACLICRKPIPVPGADGTIPTIPKPPAKMSVKLTPTAKPEPSPFEPEVLEPIILEDE
jgi:hypothetical protein